MMTLTTAVWVIDLIVVCVDLLFRQSWAKALPMLAGAPFAAVSPEIIGLFGAAALLFSVGALTARRSLRHVSANAWQGWNISAALKEEDQSIHLPYDLDLLIPVLYRRRTVQARKMTLQGRDTTAALGFSLILIMIAIVAVAAFFNGETRGLTNILAWFTGFGLVAAAVSLGYAASSIGRAGKDEKAPPTWRKFVSFVLMLPLIVCLLGALGAVSVGLSLHLDQYPPSGLDVIINIIVRSLFMGVAAWLLAYAPRKIALLTLKQGAISGRLFFIFLISSYTLWLTADWFLVLHP